MLVLYWYLYLPVGREALHTTSRGYFQTATCSSLCRDTIVPQQKPCQTRSQNLHQALGGRRGLSTQGWHPNRVTQTPAGPYRTLSPCGGPVGGPDSVSLSPQWICPALSPGKGRIPGYSIEERGRGRTAGVGPHQPPAPAPRGDVTDRKGPWRAPAWMGPLINGIPKPGQEIQQVQAHLETPSLGL